MSRVQQLHQLQLLDSEIDRLNHQLANLVAHLGETTPLKQARTAAEQARESLRRVQITIQDLTLEVKGLAEKITHEEKTLYQGKTLSAKEAANLQGEIASLKRRQSQREESLLEAMVELEEIEQKSAQTQTELAAIQVNWQVEQERLNLEQRDFKAKLSQLKEQRPILVETIDPDDLDDYEDLRHRKTGRAVAMVKNGVCQGCGITVSSSKIQEARAGTELVYCGTCGRILYAL